MRSTTAVFSFNNWFIDQVSVYFRVSWFNDSDFIFFLNYSVIKKKKIKISFTLFLGLSSRLIRMWSQWSPSKLHPSINPLGRRPVWKPAIVPHSRGSRWRLTQRTTSCWSAGGYAACIANPARSLPRWDDVHARICRNYTSPSILTSCNCTHIKPKLTRLYARVCISWFEFLLTETHKCYLIIQNIQAVPNGMWSNSP